MNYINLGSRVLKLNSKGTDVDLLQNFLKVLPEPMGTPGLHENYFGPQTEKAVKKFQKYFNLHIDGIVGKNTFLFLGVQTASYIPPGTTQFGSRTLKKGNYGNDVAILQNRLATTAKKFATALGVPANKNFSENTETAVKIFQKDVHLTDDGIAGPATFYQIYYYAGMGGRYLQRGRWDRNQGYDVYFLQRNLESMGFYKGKLDAKFGPLTETAVKELQKSVSIKVDGIVGSKSYFHLAAY